MNEPARQSPPLPPDLVCLGAVLIVATSAVVAREAQAEGMGSTWIAAARMGVASLFVLPMGLRAVWRMPAREVFGVLLSGFFLALHFATWIRSLEYTTVLVSVMLVSTAPLFVAVTSPIFTGERPGRLGILGTLVAMGGVALVVLLGDHGQEAEASDHLVGALLAIAGAMAIAGHLTIGRKLRRRLDLFAYLGLTYPAAFLALIVLAPAMEGSAGVGTTTSWLWCALLAIGPQLLGHSTFNWALRWVPAPRVATIVLFEPVAATLLAWAVFGAAEQPAWMQALGAIAILAGIRLVARDGEREDAVSDA